MTLITRVFLCKGGEGFNFTMSRSVGYEWFNEYLKGGFSSIPENSILLQGQDTNAALGTRKPESDENMIGNHGLKMRDERGDKEREEDEQAESKNDVHEKTAIGKAKQTEGNCRGCVFSFRDSLRVQTHSEVACPTSGQPHHEASVHGRADRGSPVPVLGDPRTSARHQGLLHRLPSRRTRCCHPHQMRVGAEGHPGQKA